MKKLFGNSMGIRKTLQERILSVKFIVSLAFVLLVLSAGAYQYHVTTNKDRIFWGMVDNSLKTSSFSKQSTIKSGGQSATQVTDVFTYPKQEVYARTTYTQSGVDSANATTENIGTPYNDYVRYVDITTTQRNAAGKPYDFSKIVNVWGVSPQQDPKQTNGQLFNQAVLGVLPMGNLTAAQRKQVIKLLEDKGAYKYTVEKSSKQFSLSRPSHTFTVTVNPPAYIAALKEFARSIGLNQLESIDPNQYKDSSALSFKVTVDGWSHQVTEITQATTERPETISGHNIRKVLPKVPTKTIGIDDLQSRLQSVE